MAEASNSAAADAAVTYNLDHAAHAQSLEGGAANAVAEVHGGPLEHEAEPALAGVFNATVIVSIAMAVFLLILIVKKVPALIAGVLDGRIADIRKQLDEAANLRKEAEALKAEYQAKLASVTREAEAMRAAAAEEAKQAIEDAKAHAAELIVRRQKMAEDKIASAERAAVADIRARTVQAATAAAATLIAQAHDAKADAAMVDAAIGKVGTAH